VSPRTERSSRTASIDDQSNPSYILQQQDEKLLLLLLLLLAGKRK
jgi:hypothetical protein